jgi:hypothetical protein
MTLLRLASAGDVLHNLRSNGKFTRFPEREPRSFPLILKPSTLNSHQLISMGTLVERSKGAISARALKGVPN